MNASIIGKALRFQAFIRFAAVAGVRRNELLMAAGFDSTQISDPVAHMSHALEMRMWEEAARLSGDDDFGLHLGEWVCRCPEDHFDVMVFAMRSSPTLGEHYRRVERYVRLLHEDAYFLLDVEADIARLEHGLSYGGMGMRHPVECMLTIAVLQGRLAVGDEFSPRQVRFMHAEPAQTGEHARVFRAPVHYGCARNELVLNVADLDRPQKHAELRLRAVLERQLDDLLTRLSSDRSLAARVQRYVADELPNGEPVIASVSSKMHMSARTLQRKLNDEGTNFAKLLTDVRHELARRYLEESKRPIAEVAFLLGFTEISAFHRAFKRWTGKTPAEFQRGVGRSS